MLTPHSGAPLHNFTYASWFSRGLTLPSREPPSTSRQEIALEAGPAARRRDEGYWTYRGERERRGWARIGREDCRDVDGGGLGQQGRNARDRRVWRGDEGRGGPRGGERAEARQGAEAPSVAHLAPLAGGGRGARGVRHALFQAAR